MRQVLGHRGRETLDKAYVGDEGRYARSHFGKLIQALRAELAPGTSRASATKRSMSLKP